MAPNLGLLKRLLGKLPTRVDQFGAGPAAPPTKAIEAHANRASHERGRALQQAEGAGGSPQTSGTSPRATGNVVV